MKVNGLCLCGARWTGERMEHCTACHLMFSGSGTFDGHQVGRYGDGSRRCLSVDEMRDAGMQLDSRAVWCWTARTWMPIPTPAGRAQTAEDSSAQGSGGGL